MRLTIKIDVEPGSKFCGACKCCYCDHDGHPFCGAFVTYLNDIGPSRRLKRCRDKAADGNPLDAMIESMSDLNGPVKSGAMTMEEWVGKWDKVAPVNEVLKILGRARK